MARLVEAAAVPCGGATVIRNDASTIQSSEDLMATGRVEHMERGGSMERGRALENLGEKVLRYGLVAVLLWVGALKFTEYEAMGIKPLVENSPLTAWAL